MRIASGDVLEIIDMLKGYFRKIGLYRCLMLISIFIFGYNGV